MTKIEKFEEHLIKDGITENDLYEYEKLLKKSSGNFNRLQHCYTTAIQFPEERSEDAIRLIEWGLEKYPDTGGSICTAYCRLGDICEKCGKYKKAYDSYLKAANSLDEDDEESYQSLSGNLLWMLLHIDKFTYSEQLEEYYNSFNRIDEFEKAFINNEYRLNIAEIVIYTHHKMMDKAEQAYHNAIKLSSPDAVSKLQEILTPHGAKDALRSTPEC
ncbi:MAG: hypothetical protein IKW74_05715, partial [Thermoguttaceae bacterium]|nr:hypothetical protein [Thermoguttaceae bacterium]